MGIGRILDRFSFEMLSYHLFVRFRLRDYASHSIGYPSDWRQDELDINLKVILYHVCDARSITSSYLPSATRVSEKWM